MLYKDDMCLKCTLYFCSTVLVHSLSEIRPAATISCFLSLPLRNWPTGDLPNVLSFPSHRLVGRWDHMRIVRPAGGFPSKEARSRFQPITHMREHSFLTIFFLLCSIISLSARSLAGSFPHNLFFFVVLSRRRGQLLKYDRFLLLLVRWRNPIRANLETFLALVTCRAANLQWKC